ncbi:hypothetical protein BH20VER3_BH20VER3_12350 [soil metagenome]
MKRPKKRSTQKRPKSPLAQRRWLSPLICLGLLGITWLIFGRTIGFGFFNYDDSFYVYQNPSISDGLTRAGLVRAFTHPLVGNWHPLTSLSLMLDAQLFGLNAGWYHFVNVVLHSTSVLLLFFVLRAMTGAVWRSALVAAIFAIHPLRAESVVWISERKDVLSGLFFFLGLGAYYRYCRNPALGRYLLVVVALSCGLLAKAMLVTFPFLLLLLDYWPLRRFAFAPGRSSHEGKEKQPSAGWLVAEKLPLLAPAAAICVATILSQEGALNAAHDWPLRWRVENALVTVWVYLRQMVWPTHLAVFYPHPKGTLSLWLVAPAFASLIAVTLGVFVWRRKHPYLVTGWLWYLGMLVPVIGLLQVGWQAHADRYTYLPLIGIYLLVVWGVFDLSTGWRRSRELLTGASAFVILALMVLAWKQVGYWSDTIRLWSHTLAVTENNDVAERGIGTALLSLGRIDEAIAHDREALRIRPGDVNGLTNLANALLQKKEYPEATEHYREVLRRRPNDSEMHRNLGKALYQSGAVSEAMREFREALRIRPADSDAAYSLGNALLEQGDAKAAIPFFRKAAESDPRNIAAHYNLGIALQRHGQLEEAIAEFRQTLQLDPGHVDAHNNLAIALLKKGERAAAIAEWKAALQMQPANAEMHNNLGVALLAQRRIPEALAEWRQTLQLQPDKLGTQISLAWILATAPDAAVRDGKSALEFARQAFRAAAERNLMVFRVLAAASAETGQFPDAIKAASDGAQRASAQ